MGYDLRAALHDYTRDPAVPPVPVEPATVATRMRRRRTVRAATTGLVSTAAAAVLVASAYGLTALPATDAAPAGPPTPAPTVVDATTTSEPTPRTTPTAAAPAPAPEPTPAPTATATTPPAVAGATDVPVFRTGARVGDLPSNAPEGDVVAYLTDSLGVQPKLADADYACPPGLVPGRMLTWPGTGVGVRVRTTDDADRPVDPYVAAWTLTEPSAELGLATDAGLTVGATRDDVRALHPDADYGEQEFSGALQWWFVVTDEEGSLSALGTDDGPVDRVESGYGCGE